MHPILATASAVALMSALAGAPAHAQEHGAAVVGPPAPVLPATPHTGPLPASLDLNQALAAAAARSPAIVAAEAEVDAARGRLRQAGFRANPEVSVEVENFAGSGAYSGFNGSETTVSLNQRLDLGGRRSARIGAAEAAFKAQETRLAIARAELAQSVSTQFGIALASEARLELAKSTLNRAGELARIADELVAAGREPPLRAFRARANAAQAEAGLESAVADEQAARRTLGSLLGSTEPVGSVRGTLDYSRPVVAAALATLDVRLAQAELVEAETNLGVERAAGRLDPSVGVGVRQVEETGDRALIASFSMPLQVFDRNQGNIAAARAGIRAAEARRNAAIALAGSRVRNAETAFDAALSRVQALEKVAVPQAAEAVRLSEIAYRAGKIPLVELLDTQEAFASAQAALIDAHLALVEARAALARAAAQ